jgi:hypothetical protein
LGQKIAVSLAEESEVVQKDSVLSDTTLARDRKLYEMMELMLFSTRCQQTDRLGKHATLDSSCAATIIIIIIIWCF